MRKTISILLYIISVIIGILSVAMMFIEGRLLLSGDFIIYDSVLNGLIRYLLRFIIASSYLFMVLCELIKSIRKNNFINNNLLFFELLLFMVSIIIFIFATNYIGIISFILMLLFIILKVLKVKLYGSTC